MGTSSIITQMLERANKNFKTQECKRKYSCDESTNRKIQQKNRMYKKNQMEILGLKMQYLKLENSLDRFNRY
jgi:hypothetical protein